MTNETLTYDYWCSQLVTLSRETDDRAMTANLEEIGESTATVLAEEPITSGCKVRITTDFRQLRGVVDSCTHDNVLGYFVRLQLSKDSLWNKEQCTPKHMLAVPKARTKQLRRGMAA